MCSYTIESYNSSEGIFGEISEMDVENLAKSLKCRKAPGYDGIMNAHLTFGGHNLLRGIAKLFQLIVECIPKLFNVGIIIPVPKGDKNRTRQDNYHGISVISLMTCFAKLFEKWMLSKIVRTPGKR